MAAIAEPELEEGSQGFFLDYSNWWYGTKVNNNFNIPKPFNNNMF